MFGVINVKLSRRLIEIVYLIIIFNLEIRFGIFNVLEGTYPCSIFNTYY